MGKRKEELKEEKVPEALIPFKEFEGNKPTNSFPGNKNHAIYSRRIDRYV